MASELSIEKLYRKCNPETLDCKTSAELKPAQTIIGQERAVHALQFGLGIKNHGFNIYVSGRPGTGRTTTIERFVEEIAQKEPVPPDWCYINNFEDNYTPKAIHLPAGKAKGFQRDIDNLIQTVTTDIRSAFESEEFNTHQQETVSDLEAKKQALFENLGEQAQQEGFLIQPTPVGLVTIPVRDDKPLTKEDFLALAQEERDQITKKQEKLQEAMEAALRQSKILDKEIQQALIKLDKEVALFSLTPHFNELREKYHDQPDVLDYLKQIQEDILENLADFKNEPEEENQASMPVRIRKPDPTQKYRVNVLVDNSKQTGAPVILEKNPTYNNLFGRIEREAQFGALITDFTLIRKGSLHQANGGYLVTPMEELLRNPLSWESLKRALEDREVIIEDVYEKIGFITTKGLRPEPIPLDLKVILVGTPDLYQLLLIYDEQFTELFKVRADFDTSMERSLENVRNYAAFVSSVCENENLKPLDASAIARVVEHGSRLVEDQRKLSTHFGEIADVIREANYYAGQDGSQYISADHIQKAIDERFYRSSLIHEHIREMIERNLIKIDVSTAQTGQVNGLSVVELGDIAFGQPSRITASIGMGREGLIDIEREAKLGGPIHTKGVLILSGYLAEKYAQEAPLSLSARLVFEQSYSGVEGDSASSTELYALLSALSGIAIKQGIAVTGSVNQKGEVQAIGGVNEKVEGYFEICRQKGLTGEQGVLIPESNVSNLMLNQDVLEAVQDGNFHIWPVKNIDEGIALLTGIPAGQRQEDEAFPEGTVNFAVAKRLESLAEAMVKYADGGSSNGKTNH